MGVQCIICRTLQKAMCTTKAWNSISTLYFIHIYIYTLYYTYICKRYTVISYTYRHTILNSLKFWILLQVNEKKRIEFNALALYRNTFLNQTKILAIPRYIWLWFTSTYYYISYNIISMKFSYSCILSVYVKHNEK